MKAFGISLSRKLEELLTVRERELRAVLDTYQNLHSTTAADQAGVTDFKDLASRQSLATVSETEAEHAALEFEQVLAARRRLHDHTYGRCLDCGEAIALHRLIAMPAAAFCTACQTLHETTRPSPMVH